MGIILVCKKNYTNSKKSTGKLCMCTGMCLHTCTCIMCIAYICTLDIRSYYVRIYSYAFVYVCTGMCTGI